MRRSALHGPLLQTEDIALLLVLYQELRSRTAARHSLALSMLFTRREKRHFTDIIVTVGNFMITTLSDETFVSEF